MNIVKIEVTGEIRSYVNNDADQAQTDPNSQLLTRLFATLLDGNGAGQCNQVYTKTDTIIADATNTIDLVTGPNNVFGEQIVFTKIVGFAFKNTSTTASVLALGGGSNGAGLNAFDTWITSTAADGSEAVLVAPGGMVLIYNPSVAGYAVAAASDLMAIDETSSLAGSYEIGFIGIE